MCTHHISELVYLYLLHDFLYMFRKSLIFSLIQAYFLRFYSSSSSFPQNPLIHLALTFIQT